MKKLISITAYLIIFYTIYLAIINYAQNIILQMGAVKGLVNMGLPEYNINCNLGLYTLIILASGIFFGACFLWQFYTVQKEKLNAYKRELEKSSVSNSSNSSRVEVLEAKITTLEKALDNALKNKNQ